VEDFSSIKPHRFQPSDPLSDRPANLGALEAMKRPAKS
jgi:hypothetical protein